MRGVFGAWRLPLRMARRDVLRHRGRSILVLAMIALPVLAVTAADVLMQTSKASGVETLDRRMGAAAALVTVQEGSGRLEQGPDPDVTLPSYVGSLPGSPTAKQLSKALGGARLLEIRGAEISIVTAKGAVRVEANEVDLADPVTRGLAELTAGRWPSAPGEVVINRALEDKGFGLGDTLQPQDADLPSSTVVGLAESASIRDFPVAYGPAGAFDLPSDVVRQWLVDGPPVTWDMVGELNALGALVASRAVLTDPPPKSAWPVSVQSGSSTDSSTMAILILIVVMTLLEVVLLAGPAFAVGARKQQHSLALMSATGGTPTQSRRVIVASAIVLGGAAAAVGVVLGIAVAAVAEPFLQSRSFSYFGPFEIPWLHVAGIAGFGVLSAFLAAVVPAYIASRQDVVAVLAGRRGDRAPSLKSPILGLVLLGAGVAGSVVGARGVAGTRGIGEILIAASAIPTMLGMILLIPLMLAGLGRIGDRLPLVLRYAVRDAARHRTRTVPAVAAVAATVAGVVALSIGLTSDEAENRETYSAALPNGMASLTANGANPAWSSFRSIIEREAPGAQIVEQTGLPEIETADGGYAFPDVRVAGLDYLLDSYGTSLGASVLTSDGPLPLGLTGISDSEARLAERQLRAGGAVVFVSRDVGAATRAKFVWDAYDGQGEETGMATTVAEATFIRVGTDVLSPLAIVSSPVAERLGVEPAIVGLTVAADQISVAQQSAIDEAVAGLDVDTSFYVERGFVPDDEAVIAQLILLALGGVLMLGGTLTATFLALSDARPDLATLAAVGASPRTRRGVAAAYAVVVGFVGAVLGAAVGFIPGIAVTRPLTTNGFNSTGDVVGPFLDVPWLAILGLVIVLPLLTAAIVGLAARSRLPLVARLD
jgi:putative ABC transport system permease protein